MTAQDKATGTPCMGCQVRAEGCHGQCKAYQDYREALAELRAVQAAGAPTNHHKGAGRVRG